MSAKGGVDGHVAWPGWLEWNDLAELKAAEEEATFATLERDTGITTMSAGLVLYMGSTDISVYRTWTAHAKIDPLFC
jgi:hypothetical protein